ncbi:helix-turn-helix domain-containing protein [Novosphingobium terrae]|uniref:helix-turn-helix domain-containing protein n=1 Tax=Novosphingobium terrae TaxID=2726189 RepID=UPI00197E4E6C|nr:helix-turn-helix domain-containing protein [Novosphingobium terrae]
MTQTNKDILALNVVRLLKAQRKRLQDLAQEAGISKSVVSEIVNLKSNPTLETIEKIAEALGVSVIELLSAESAQQAPKGYEIVTALVDKFCAAQIRVWEAAAKSRLKG